MFTHLHLAQLVTGCLVAAVCVAQPVFTASDFTPNIGDQYTVGRGSAIIPTNTGANQTWDFSNANMTGSATYTVNPLSMIPAGSQYPTANMGIGAGAYDMVQVTATEYNSVGNTSTPAMAQFVYSDPEKCFEFPMTFNYSFSDNYSGVSNQGPFPIYQEGADTVTYDGYGTLITPYGTYTNAMRINKELTYTDSTQSNTIVCSGHYTYWFVPGYRYPVVVTWIVNCTAGFSAGLEILQSITIGVEENESANSSFAVFPNPFNTIFTLTTTTEFSGQTVSVTDIAGRIVKSFVITGSQMEIELGELENGIYILTTGNQQRRVVVKSSL